MHIHLALGTTLHLTTMVLVITPMHLTAMGLPGTATCLTAIQPLIMKCLTAMEERVHKLMHLTLIMPSPPTCLTVVTMELISPPPTPTVYPK
jgi:hypothetical protein